MEIPEYLTSFDVAVNCLEVAKWQVWNCFSDMKVSEREKIEELMGEVSGVQKKLIDLHDMAKRRGALDDLYMEFD